MSNKIFLFSTQQQQKKNRRKISLKIRKNDQERNYLGSNKIQLYPTTEIFEICWFTYSKTTINKVYFVCNEGTYFKHDLEIMRWE